MLTLMVTKRYGLVLAGLLVSLLLLAGTASAAPTVTGITPSTGVNTTTVSITSLTGTNFVPGANVQLTPVNSNPVHKGSIVDGIGGAFLNSPRGVYVSGNYAYIASFNNNVLEIVNVTDPANPVHEGSIHDGDGGALLAAPISVYVSGNYAYVASYGSNALEIVNVTDPAHPVNESYIVDTRIITPGAVGSPFLDGPKSVYVSGNFAYVASEFSNSVEIVNVADPANPVDWGSIVYDGIYGIIKLNRPEGVYVSGNYAYVASGGSSALEVVDVTDPHFPFHGGSLVNAGIGAPFLASPTSVYVSGNYAYVASGGSHALEIVDVTNPYGPVHESSITNGAGGALLAYPASVYVSGNYAYIASSGSSPSSISNALEIVDVTNPANPVHKGSIVDGDGGAHLVDPKCVYVSGNYAYIVSAQSYGKVSNALEIVDIGTVTGTGLSVPSATQITGTFDLTNKTPGPYNVVVTNPDGSFGTLAGGFTITPPAPTVSNAATDLAGANITLTFNKAMASANGKQAEFLYQVNGGADQSFSAASVNTGNTAQINLTTSGTPIVFGDTVTVRYTPGTVTALDGGILATFSGQAVANNKAAGPAPTVTGAATDLAGANITITFNKAMASANGKQAEFLYQVNGGADQSFSAASVNTGNTAQINLTTSGTPIASGDTVTVRYTPGTITARDGGVLATFSGQAVANNKPAGPAAYFTGTPTAGTVPLTVTFTDASTCTPTEWNWSFGDGTYSTLQDPSHTYVATGSYTVILNATNATPASNYLTRTGYITVSAVPTRSPSFAPVQSSGGSDDSGPASARIPAPAGTLSVNVGGTTPVTTVVVTGTGLNDLIVTSTEAYGPGTGIPLPPGTVFEYLDITPARYGTITGAQISFTIPQTWLDEHHFTPGNIVLYHNTGTSWQALTTSLDHVKDGNAYFTATSPGFSRFAITGHAGLSAGSSNQTPSPPVQISSDLKTSPATGSTTPAAPEFTGIPVTTQTTIIPVTPQPAPGFPLTTVALIGAGCIVLIGGGWYVRRWWIRRQNPALFEEY